MNSQLLPEYKPEWTSTDYELIDCGYGLLVDGYCYELQRREDED